MKPASNNDAPKGPKQPSRHSQAEIPSSSVQFGFPVSVNQFQVLQTTELQPAGSTSQVQDRLIDPRTTRLARQRAASGTTE